MQTKKRPKFLDVHVLAAALPIPGKVSILHRISGVALFAMLPILLALLSGSLSSGEAFEYYDPSIDELSTRSGRYKILYGSSSLDKDLKEIDFVVK